jgi:hypothetical protein
MHRRPLGRGRVLAALAAVVMLAGCLLPWYGVGGAGGLPLRQLMAFDGSGILVFVAALGTLALVALPYAAGDRPVSLDSSVAYLLLFILGLVGILVWPLELLGDFVGGLLPDRAPGYWLAIAGLVVHARAVYEVFQEPPRR